MSTPITAGSAGWNTLGLASAAPVHSEDDYYGFLTQHCYLEQLLGVPLEEVSHETRNRFASLLQQLYTVI